MLSKYFILEKTLFSKNFKLEFNIYAIPIPYIKGAKISLPSFIVIEISNLDEER